MVIEDRALIRAGLVKIIESREGLEVTAEVGLGTDRSGPLSEGPDVVVMDFDLTDPALFSTILQYYPRARILVVTSSDDLECSRRAIRLGAFGVVSIRTSPEAFITAIERVAAGEAWLGRALTAQVLAELSPFPEMSGAAKLALLSKREREIVDIACEGLSIKEIARRLLISTVTVRHHLTAIFAKLGVTNRHSLIVFAYRHRRSFGAS